METKAEDQMPIDFNCKMRSGGDRQSVELFTLFVGYLQGERPMCGTNNFVSGAPIPSGQTLCDLMNGEFGLDPVIMFVEFVFQELAAIYPIDTWTKKGAANVVDGHLVAAKTPMFGTIAYAGKLFILAEHVVICLRKLYRRMNDRDKASLVTWLGARELYCVFVFNGSKFHPLQTVQSLCRIQQDPTLVGHLPAKWKGVFYHETDDPRMHLPSGSFSAAWMSFRADRDIVAQPVLPVHLFLGQYLSEIHHPTFHAKTYSMDSCALLCREMVASFYQLIEEQH